jgi:hypothetical protein
MQAPPPGMVHVVNPDGTVSTVMKDQSMPNPNGDGTLVAKPPPPQPSVPDRINNGRCTAMKYTGNMALPPSCPAQ